MFAWQTLRVESNNPVRGGPGTIFIGTTGVNSCNTLGYNSPAGGDAIATRSCGDHPALLSWLAWVVAFFVLGLRAAYLYITNGR